ncbi:Ankyrin-2 [Neopestalotiopsis sp. 37M]|nr:Ankyrin-2 [Neopestalotiopsis sp. 37M]
MDELLEGFVVVQHPPQSEAAGTTTVNAMETYHLAKLPNEIILLIIDHLPHPRDYSAWSRTGQYFHSIVNPALYEAAISRTEWRVVFWAAQHGRVGTLRRWVSIRNPDGSIRAPLDVYTVRPNFTNQLFSAYNPISNPISTRLPFPNAQRYNSDYTLGAFVQGPLDRETRVRHNRCQAPLHIAAKFGHVDVVEFLLDHGADINAHSLGLVPNGLSVFRDARDRSQWSVPDCVTLNALHVAILSGKAEVGKVLIRRGIDLELAPLRAGHESRIAALHLAAAYPYDIGNITLLKMMAQLPGVNVNAPDVDGQPPLMYAAECQSNNHPSMRALIDVGADVNCQVTTREGFQGTLLVALIRRARWSAAAYLIDKGATREVGRGQRTLLEECERAKMSVIYPDVVKPDEYEALVSRVISVAPQLLMR